MKTKRLTLSGWPNKWLMLLLVCGSCFAQSAMTGSKKSLNSQFSSAALHAYQQNSDGKIRDFYHYLNLLSDTTDEMLKSQMQQSIYTLFEDRNVVLANPLAEKSGRIPLSYLLENVFGRKMKFALLSVTPRTEFHQDFWIDDYLLQISTPESTRTVKLSQVVFLKSKTKSFGQSEKTVWNLSLGTISSN